MLKMNTSYENPMIIVTGEDGSTVDLCGIDNQGESSDSDSHVGVPSPNGKQLEDDQDGACNHSAPAEHSGHVPSMQQAGPEADRSSDRNVTTNQESGTFGEHASALPGESDRSLNTLGRNRRALRHRPEGPGSEFIRSIRRKDASAVAQLQKADPNLLLYTYTNQRGETAAEWAVLSKSTAILDSIVQNVPLTERPKLIQRFMLYAIRENDSHILQHLLYHYKNTKLQWRRDGLNWDSTQVQSDTGGHGNNCAGNQPTETKLSNDGKSNRSDKQAAAEQTARGHPVFRDSVTPLVLAAQLGRYELIYMLKDQMAPDIHPLSQTCPRKNCLICRSQTGSQGLGSIEECRRFLEILKALSSATYIFITCNDDPILTAFLISDACFTRMQREVAFSVAYEEVIQTCRQFSTDLLSLCETSQEVQTLLNCSNGLDVINAKGRRARFPRLQLAIHYNQKQFVAHPNCQHLLLEAWIRGLPAWVHSKGASTLYLPIYLILLMLAFPVTFALYMFPVCPCIPIQRLERFVKEPAGKYLHDLASYFLFLVLLFLTALSRSDDQRGHPLSALEWLLAVWVAGLTLRFAKIGYYRRNAICTSKYWLQTHVNWQFGDVIVLVSFWLFFLLRVVSWGLGDTPASTGDRSNTRNATASNTGLPARLQWPDYDPYLASEVFFATGCILAVINVFSLLKMHPRLGPLQMSMKRMRDAFIRFLVLFGIVLAAFTLGLYILYSGYYIKDTTGETVINPHLTTMTMASKTLFWNIFGYGDPDQADLSMDMKIHRYHEIIGYIYLGMYHVIVVIFLANMLIAMVTNLYNDIETNADEEWKFAMTQLRITYFNEIGVIPPPFNLLPTRKIIKWLWNRFGKRDLQNHYQVKRYQSCQADYTMLIASLQKRYWQMQRERKKKNRCRCGEKRSSVAFGDSEGEAEA